jgi:signal transduction histidine kinase
MRSLTLKLTLAFMLVGLVGVVLVAVLVGGLTRREFDQFVLDRYQSGIIEQAAAYYETTGSWDGLDNFFLRQSQRAEGRRTDMRRAVLYLLDADGQVVVDNRNPDLQNTSAQPDKSLAVPVESAGQVVGFIQFTFPTGTFDMERLPPELEFLSRVNRAIVVSALVAMLLALLIGATLASTISRPVRELTAATKALAGGDLGHQVPVRTDDEVGELAQSFNQMSADLARSNQIRKQMTADIAHDLRTPLSVILGYSEALADGKLPGNVETYGAMHLQAQHLSRLIDDLRTLSLADAGQLSLQRREVDPLDLLEHTALANLPQAEARRITLNVQGERGTVILVDPDRLVQVLGNLVGNALRHTPDGGTVTLSTEPSGGQICMQVRDNGSGIAPNDLPHVFDRFYRADQSRTGDGSSGLGLAIARSLIEAHGGQISVTSETGHGSCFTVCLPAVSGSV